MGNRLIFSNINLRILFKKNSHYTQEIKRRRSIRRLNRAFHLNNKKFDRLMRESEIFETKSNIFGNGNEALFFRVML